jgi:thiol-disulfide isomerase/thioredoxin
VVGAIWVTRSWISPGQTEIKLTVARHEFDQKDAQEDPLVYLSSIPKPKILVCWTLGCIPCLKFLIICNKMKDFFDEQGIEILPLLISHHSNQPVVLWGYAVVYLTGLIQKNTLSRSPWQVLFPKLTPYYDAQGQIFSKFKVAGTPFTVFLNKKNQVVAHKEGLQNWQDPKERAKLDELIAQMKR